MANWNIFQPEDIEIKQQLGGDHKFNVFLGIVKNTGELVVVKNIKVDKRELDILKELRHKNIIRLLGTIYRDLSTGLVLEYAPKGSLYDFLNIRPINHYDYLEWCKQAVRSVVYIHGQDVSHRDIKSKNFLVFGDNIKLIDFGLSKVKKHDVTSTTSNSGRGTFIWMSPEVMNGSKGVDHFKSDVYSLGIVLWELYHQRRPYEDLNVPSIIQHVVNGGHPKIDGKCDVRDVMLKCWNYQPDQRPNAEQILTSLDNKKQKQILGIHKDNHIEFRKLLSDLSKDYVGLKYRWLRMLLHSIIPIGCLELSTTGFQLFNKLDELGKISKTNVTLLSEVAETTGQTSAKDRIAEYKRTIQCSETLGTRLTPYRKALFKTIVDVGHNDLLNVINFYSLNDHDFGNIWDVVFHLEKEKHLEDSQEKCKLFAELLNMTAQNILLDAYNLKIREETEYSSQQSESTHQPETVSFSDADLRANVKQNLTSLDKKTDTLVSSRSSARKQEKHIPRIGLLVAVLIAIVVATVATLVMEPTTEQTTTPFTPKLRRHPEVHPGVYDHSKRQETPEIRHSYQPSATGRVFVMISITTTFILMAGSILVARIGR